MGCQRIKLGTTRSDEKGKDTACKFELEPNRLFDKLQSTNQFTQAPQAIQHGVKVGKYADRALASDAALHKFMLWKKLWAAEKSETLPLRALAWR